MGCLAMGAVFRPPPLRNEVLFYERSCYGQNLLAEMRIQRDSACKVNGKTSCNQQRISPGLGDHGPSGNNAEIQGDQTKQGDTKERTQNEKNFRTL